MIDKYQPDIVLEVLPFTRDALAACERHRVTLEVLERSEAFLAADEHYGWLLRFRG